MRSPVSFEEDEAILTRLVLRVMQTGFIEHDVLAVTPGVGNVVDDDRATVVVPGAEAEVIAQRPGKRIAVRIERAVGGQHREHRGLHGGNALEDFDRARAERGGRRMRPVIPLQVKALYAGFYAVSAGCVAARWRASTRACQAGTS